MNHTLDKCPYGGDGGNGGNGGGGGGGGGGPGTPRIRDYSGPEPNVYVQGRGGVQRKEADSFSFPPLPIQREFQNWVNECRVEVHSTPASGQGGWGGFFRSTERPSADIRR